MKCAVLIPEGKIALGKLAQAVAHGARVISIEGNFDQALELVRQISESEGIALVNSVNRYRLEGQKTAAFEVVDALGRAPDFHALPVGNAGNITSYWMGFQQYHALKQSGLPRILGVQAAGAAPLVVGHPIDQPQTIASAIRIGNPARGEQALQAAEESGGKIIAVSDAEILAMQRYLASEGVWGEPASAAGLAGFVGEVRAGKLNPRGKLIVVICTGHGLKDPEIITRQIEPLAVLPARLDALEDFVLEGTGV
jgi:threonine synthase